MIRTIFMNSFIVIIANEFKCKHSTMENNKRMASGDNSRLAEEAQQGPLSESRNPLLNDVVLTRLFELCHPSDLPRFRLVSKKWHALASDSFRRDVPVAFESPWSSSGRRRFESFCEFDPEKIPFGNFRMKHMVISPLSGDSGESSLPVEFLTFRNNMAQFWGRYGRCIRKLELWHLVVHSVELFKKAIFEEIPNLEELSLFDIKDETENPSPPGTVDGENIKMQRNLKRLVVNPLCCLPVRWDLLRHFPNIQSVEITPRDIDTIFMDNGKVAGYLREISEQLTTMRRPCRIKVNELKLWLRSQAHATFSKTVLQIPQLSLLKLQLMVEFNDSEDCEMELLSTAIRHQGENLEDLYVYSNSLHRESPYDNFPFKLGPFNSTTSIHLVGNVCENLHFLKHFPNLQILQMDSFGADLMERTESTTMETFTLEALKDLRFAMISHIAKDKMEMLVKVMPSVETFHGRLTNESFRVLCREWKQLKALFIVTSFQFDLRIDDEGITGIICGSEERLPNITDLEALESLTVYNGKGLSDASIFSGFLQMANLKNLSVKISPDASENAFRALTKKFPDGNITRSTSSGNEDSP